MIDILKPLIKQFMPYAQEKMGFSRPPRLFLRSDKQNAVNPLGKTGFYDPQAESITLYTTGRHPKDIMRSLAHELMHHTQKCNGDFDNIQNMGEQGYAQNDPHMRNMEIQAYQASIVFRDWEDSTKGTIYYEHLQKGDKSSMSTKKWKNGELKSLLSEAWGFKMDLSKLNEKKEETVEEAFGTATHSNPSDRRTGRRQRKPDDWGKDPAAYTGTKEKEDEAAEDLKTGKALQEDSGEEEKRHYEDDDWKDKDRIEAIRRHLDALEHDKDYDHDREALEESPGHPTADRMQSRDSARRGKDKNGRRTESLTPQAKQALKSKLMDIAIKIDERKLASRKEIRRLLETAQDIYDLD